VREGVAISYQSCGEGDTTLLFVHGWCINKTYWDEQVKYFCPRYRVITLDLPGFGESGKNRTNWSFDEYTADIKYLIDTLQLKNVVLIGHSMSGDLVLKAGNQYPNSLVGLVGIDNLHEPGAPMNEQAKKETNEYFDLMASKFDSTVTASMMVSLFQPSTDTSIVKRVMKDVYDSDPLIATNVLRSLVDVAQQEKPLMQGLQHRLFLINSSVQPISPDSLAKYCAKGFEMINIGATGHYPMLEKPYEFNKALELVMRKVKSKK
jgi:pimeloyl-ACP methyl ester carboxylesterase